MLPHRHPPHRHTGILSQLGTVHPQMSYNHKDYAPSQAASSRDLMLHHHLVTRYNAITSHTPSTVAVTYSTLHNQMIAIAHILCFITLNLYKVIPNAYPIFHLSIAKGTISNSTFISSIWATHIHRYFKGKRYSLITHPSQGWNYPSPGFRAKIIYIEGPQTNTRRNC